MRSDWPHEATQKSSRLHVQPLSSPDTSFHSQIPRSSKVICRATVSMFTPRFRSALRPAAQCLQQQRKEAMRQTCISQQMAQRRYKSSRPFWQASKQLFKAYPFSVSGAVFLYVPQWLFQSIPSFQSKTTYRSNIIMLYIIIAYFSALEHSCTLITYTTTTS